MRDPEALGLLRVAQAFGQMPHVVAHEMTVDQIVIACAFLDLQLEDDADA